MLGTLASGAIRMAQAFLASHVVSVFTVITALDSTT